MAGMTSSGDRVGFNRVTGALLTGFDHCLQSILDIFTTRINTRIMRLDYGSDGIGLLDRPGNRQTIALFYSTMVTALLKWEPGFRINQFYVVDANGDGQFTFEMVGIFYPRGHLGDYSVSQDATSRFVMSATGELLIAGA